MSITLLYTIFFISLFGILGVLSSKMKFVDDFLKKHRELKQSHLGTSAPEQSGLLGKYLNIGSLKSRGPFLKIQEWLDKKIEERRQAKLKRIEQRRMRQLKTMQKDQVIEKQIDGDLIAKNKSAQSDSSSTTVSTSSKKKHELEKQETRLINKVALEPQNKENYRTLGGFYLEQKKGDDAKECYKHVLKIDPEDEDARIKIERLQGKI